jgi:hypothetical protein
LSSALSGTLKISGPGAVGIRKLGLRGSVTMRAVWGGLELRRTEVEAASRFRIQTLDGRRVAETTMAAGVTTAQVRLKPGTYVVVPEADRGVGSRSIAVLH